MGSARTSASSPTTMRTLSSTCSRPPNRSSTAKKSMLRKRHPSPIPSAHQPCEVDVAVPVACEVPHAAEEDGEAAGLDNPDTLGDTEMEMDMDTTTTVEDTILTEHTAEDSKDNSTAVNNAVHARLPDINLIKSIQKIQSCNRILMS